MGSYGSHVQVDSRTELVIAVDIAKRLGISPQRVNVLASGPGFPEAARQARPVVGLALEQRRAVGSARPAGLPAAGAAE